MTAKTDNAKTQKAMHRRAEEREAQRVKGGGQVLGRVRVCGECRELRVTRPTTFKGIKLPRCNPCWKKLKAVKP